MTLTLDHVSDRAADLETLHAIADPADEYDTPAPELDPLLEIDALDQADRHLREVARLRDALAVHDELYRRAIDRLHDRHDERRAIIERQISWHLTPVEQLHLRLLAIDPKRKTLELPHGTSAVTVPVKPKVWIDDDDAVTAWARNNAPELLPQADKVKVTDLRNITTIVTRPDGTFSVITRHGEPVPGVHAAVPDPKWRADTDPEGVL